MCGERVSHRPTAMYFIENFLQCCCHRRSRCCCCRSRGCGRGVCSTVRGAFNTNNVVFLMVRKLSATRVSRIILNMYVWLVCQRHNPYLFDTTYLCVCIHFILFYIVRSLYFARSTCSSRIIVSLSLCSAKHELNYRKQNPNNKIMRACVSIKCVYEWRMCVCVFVSQSPLSTRTF